MTLLFYPYSLHHTSGSELWEIAENLHRAELTALDRDEHIARWVDLAEQQKVAQIAPPGGQQPKEAGVRAATKELGLDRRDVQRARTNASLTPEAKESAKEVGLDDNRTALLEAAKAEPAQQASIIRTMAEKRDDGPNGELTQMLSAIGCRLQAPHNPCDRGIRRHFAVCSRAEQRLHSSNCQTLGCFIDQTPSRTERLANSVCECQLKVILRTLPTYLIPCFQGLSVEVQLLDQPIPKAAAGGHFCFWDGFAHRFQPSLGRCDQVGKFQGFNVRIFNV